VIENLSRRGTADAYPAPLRHAPNAALLIDFDNVTMGVRSDLQLQLKRLLSSEVFKGKISVQRAYADWRRYPQYIVPLSEASIDLIFAPAFGSNKKNATDIRLAIDALELVFTRPEIGTYILLSGDSDFSSLVLKLKEYGKYVIGVGIRESSSDLLIQNCDEYFSYNELTGLLKEGEVEQRRQDPWELVVEAVTRMQRANDIMRSDRLKQVMQEIDPTFSEKDAGFSKYSKFLQEASRRGLLRLAKLENGQYEIVLGANANVPIAVERELDRPEREAPPPRRRGGRGRGAGAAAAPATPATVAEGLPLSEAFALLRRALTEIGAVGEESTDADQTRERMAELVGGDDPLFEMRRFQRFLRQAHDADMVDLVKSDDGAYLLRLRPDAPAVEAEAGAGSEPDGERGRRRRGERGGRSRRGGRRPRGDAEAAPAADREPSEEPRTPAVHRGPVEEPAVAVPDAGVGAPEAKHRNPRFRHGSRSSHAPKPEPRPAPEAAPTEPAVTGPVSHNRSLRGRGGRRGTGPGQRLPEEQAPAPPPAPEMEAAPAAPAPRHEPVAPPVRSAPPVRLEPRAPAPAADDQADAGESGGLFKRMSAALQRAMLGQPKDEPPSDS
jgi:uncharacterized protein (TIGR00288 family)